MSTIQHQPHVELKVKRPPLPYRRRPQSKDILLANKPPWVLGAGIIATAVFFLVSITALRSVEYKDAAPLNLTVNTGTSSNSYLEGTLLQQEAMRVKIGQVVLVEVPPALGGGEHSLALKVNSLSPVCDHARYLVRVDLPPDLAPLLNKGIGKSETLIRGRIVIQEYSLFERVFRALSNSVGRS